MENKEKYFNDVASYKLLAKHEVGQNFLVDPDVCEKIVGLASLTNGDYVLEIGSGAGSLSYFIASSFAESDLIDIDPMFIEKLTQDFADKKNVHVKQANIMRFDLAPYSKIIGNLPYYITSGILERIALTSKAKLAILMVQKEVFPRLAAKVGDEAYGPLSILLEYRGVLKKEFYVPRTSFTPVPHVESLVFSMSFNPDSTLETAQKLYSLVSALFLHRRKTIFNNLSFYLKNSDKARAVLASLQIEENRRPEQISLKEYLSMLSRLL
jgi:16S rRNA (adenine1518-N6/adenine1519-N6)-dimethyltransferase